LSACFRIRNSRSHQARPHAENLPESSFQKCAAAEIFAGLVGERLGFIASGYNEPVEVHKHCCYGKGGEDDRGLGSGRQQPQYPIGTVAMYGPDDWTTTKIAAGVILHNGAEPIMKRWMATDVTTNPKVQPALKDFFLQPADFTDFAEDTACIWPIIIASANPTPHRAPPLAARLCNDSI
jgi:hypothetical protein